MEKVTIKTIGWTIFGVCFLIMFYGMFISVAISNMDSEFRTVHTINIDNQTKEALIELSKIKNSNTKCIVKEWETDTESYRYLTNEYITKNCSIAQKE